MMNVDLCFAKDPRLADAGGTPGKPVLAALPILLREVHTADPHGWDLGCLALDARQRIVFGINPDPPAKQVHILALWGHIDHISNPAIERSGLDQLKCVVIRSYPVLGTHQWPRGF